MSNFGESHSDNSLRSAWRWNPVRGLRDITRPYLSPEEVWQLPYLYCGLMKCPPFGWGARVVVLFPSESEESVTTCVAVILIFPTTSWGLCHAVWRTFSLSRHVFAYINTNKSCGCVKRAVCSSEDSTNIAQLLAIGSVHLFGAPSWTW